MSTEGREAAIASTNSLGDYDVLLGRGPANVTRKGNKWFNALLDSHLQKYEALSDKSEKTALIHYIFDQIAQRGRFLKIVASPGNGDPIAGSCVYEEIGETTAREKISHAIRYRIRLARTKGPSSKRASRGVPRRGPSFSASCEEVGSVVSTSAAVATPLPLVEKVEVVSDAELFEYLRRTSDQFTPTFSWDKKPVNRFHCGSTMEPMNLYSFLKFAGNDEPLNQTASAVLANCTKCEKDLMEPLCWRKSGQTQLSML